MKMKIRIKLVGKIVFALVITFAFGFLLYKLYSPRLSILEFVISQKAKRMQVRLLCKTEHEVLLEACRELSRQVAAGDLNPGSYSVRDGHGSPEVSRFPKAILDLGPSDVFIREDGCVILDITFGRLGRFGVRGYPEDFEKPFHGFEYGDRELVDGLWYYDDEYEANPKYQKRIEALIQKSK